MQSEAIQLLVPQLGQEKRTLKLHLDLVVAFQPVGKVRGDDGLDVEAYGFRQSADLSSQGKRLLHLMEGLHRVRKPKKMLQFPEDRGGSYLGKELFGGHDPPRIMRPESEAPWNKAIGC